jgi:hypothetical protein
MAPEKPTSDPLEGWKSGFTREAAIFQYEDSLGAELPGRPDIDPDMPNDVTLLASDGIGRLHALFVSYTGWLESELSLAEISADEEQAFFEHIEAQVHLTRAGTVADKKAKTKNDPRYIAAEQKSLVAHARAKLLRARVRSYERCCGALSREMTRRLGAMEREREQR